MAEPIITKEWSTDELDSINRILIGIGESPVNTIKGLSASRAQKVMLEISKQEQSVGWWFNTEVDYVLTPDVNGNIVNNEIQSIKIEGKNIVQRGQYLYDQTNQTYSFSEPLKAEVIWSLGWDYTPQVFRTYVINKSIRLMNTTESSNSNLQRINLQDEEKALHLLKREDAVLRQGNYLTGSDTMLNTLKR